MPSLGTGIQSKQQNKDRKYIPLNSRLERRHKYYLFFCTQLTNHGRSTNQSMLNWISETKFLIIVVDAEIWSPFARPDHPTNACMINGEDAALCLLRQLLKLLGLESPFFFSLTLRSHKQIRDASGFAGVNPPMLKLAQGVYGKTCMISVV